MVSKEERLWRISNGEKQQWAVDNSVGLQIENGSGEG